MAALIFRSHSPVTRGGQQSGEGMLSARAFLLHAVKAIYVSVPGALANDAEMIGAFALIGASFYFLFQRGRIFSVRAALGYVFRRDFFCHRTSRVDILHFFLTVGFWIPAIGTFVTMFLSVDIRNFLSAWFGARPATLHASWLIAVLQFAVIFVCRDFGTYVGHYLLHKVPVLWSVHRTHHSAEVLTFFTSARAHPLEYLHAQGFMAVFGGLGGSALMYFTGTSLEPAAVALLLGAGLFFELFGLAHHSHVPISFGKLNCVLFAPMLHQLHHSAELRHRDKNLGGQLAIFDWLFGTLYIPQPGENYRWGLNEHELGENNPHLKLRDFYLEPARHAWRQLVSGSDGGDYAQSQRETVVGSNR
jgi:sterol desaturase/sphingolipid hydroxylase (fatty acid hydroxylase superfamily)